MIIPGIFLGKVENSRIEMIETTDSVIIMPSTTIIAMTAILRVIITAHVTNGMARVVMRIGIDPHEDKNRRAVAGVSLPGRGYHQNSRDQVQETNAMVMRDISAKNHHAVAKVRVDTAKKAAETIAEARKIGIITIPNNLVLADTEIMTENIQGTEMSTEDRIEVTIIDTIEMTVIVTSAVMNVDMTSMTTGVVAAIIHTLERLAGRL